MLETKNQQLIFGVPRSLPDDHIQTTTMFADKLGMLRRQLWIIALCASIGVVLGAGALFFIKPNFSATATLLIDTKKYENASKSDLVGREAYESNAAVDSQMEILKSRAVAVAVVSRLN